ncbi:hypothetical protein [Paracoccus sp. IB05]|uniref:hypothetical protein n=1 Tax=Paracoccus sp. IB05 TaxID=2779367 RepID=UPI0018E721D1|nr:hypothetical protein [Paracoccus sp. IB05]MBJ2151967.1 hypothetical protein [Paracoccus sp. IB05]
MIRAVLVIAGIAATQAVSPALACSVDMSGYSNLAKHGKNCAISWQTAPAQSVSLSEAKAIGVGFVVQTTFEGFACGGAVNYVVQDCAAGRALVLGPEILDTEKAEPENYVAFDDLLAREGARPGFGLGGVARLADERGMNTAQEVSISSGRLHLSAPGPDGEMTTRIMKLDCGCKTLFPEMGGKG